MANQGSPQLVSLVDPYVYQTIKKLIGSKFIIQTVRDTVRGRLIDVKPDHIIIEAARNSVFLISIQHIISVTPDYSERV
ncbi:YuzF family protein [Bacillus halotolerans]|uniref:YuzF family protein n=1 Tax=Bacillus halotolerans TaxID=260554 RepID=UPI001C3E7828|nr:YuzF family protein [Bacillus halotolerans]MBV5123498.1 YuzF family protein [Bacillus halotolerans]MCC2115506.1 YuzF family protein [Bacillus halotolerans]